MTWPEMAPEQCWEVLIAEFGASKLTLPFNPSQTALLPNQDRKTHLWGHGQINALAICKALL